MNDFAGIFLGLVFCALVTASSIASEWVRVRRKRIRIAIFIVFGLAIDGMMFVPVLRGLNLLQPSLAIGFGYLYGFPMIEGLAAVHEWLSTPPAFLQSVWFQGQAEDRPCLRVVHSLPSTLSGPKPED